MDGFDNWKVVGSIQEFGKRLLEELKSKAHWWWETSLILLQEDKSGIDLKKEVVGDTVEVPSLGREMEEGVEKLVVGDCRMETN